MNTSKLEITLKPQWFAHLPEKLGCAASPLLPAFEAEPQTAATAFREMQNAGILDSSGRVMANLLKPMKTLVQAKSCCRLKMLCEGDLLEYQVLWLDKSSEPVALSRAEDGFVLSAPADSNELLALLAEFTGIGSFAVIPPVGAFDKTQAVVLAACHDLIRKAMFMNMAGVEEELKISVEQVHQHIHHPVLSSESLTWIIQATLQQPVMPDFAQTQQAIMQLEKLGYLSATAAGYVPEEGLVFLCRRMLMFNNLIKLESMRVDGDSIPAACFASVQCGLRDLMMIEVTDDNISFNGISSQQLLLVLREFLTNPEAVKIASPAQGKGDNCVCGKPFAADASFCKFCGKPRPAAVEDERPGFCSKCGSALKPGKTFCTKCGNKAG